MRLYLLASLIAAVTALPSSLNERSTCGVGTSGGLTGPFKLKAKSSGGTNGNYAFGENGAKFVFELASSSGATDFYLTSGGHVVIKDGGATYTAFEKDPTTKASQFIEIGTSTSTNLICSIDSSSCALACKVDGYTYNCLASPLDKPDWRIAASASVAAANCVPFTPIVVAA